RGEAFCERNKEGPVNRHEQALLGQDLRQQKLVDFTRKLPAKLVYLDILMKPGEYLAVHVLPGDFPLDQLAHDAGDSAACLLKKCGVVIEYFHCDDIRLAQGSFPCN